MVDPKEFWESKAEELKQAGKFEEAIKILDKVQEIEKEEHVDDFWYKKAVQFCEIGEYEQAKDSLNRDIEKNQKSYDSFFLMGKILFNLKKYEESLESYNKASEEYNRKHLKHSHKIDHMKNAHKFEEAVKYSDLIYQEKELEDEYWQHKGKVLQKLGKFVEASSCFETVLERNPKNPKALYELAKSELFAGNKERSLNLIKKACSLESSLGEKLRVDKDFSQISQEKEFRVITGLVESDF